MEAASEAIGEVKRTSEPSRPFATQQEQDVRGAYASTEFASQGGAKMSMPTEAFINL